VTAKRKLTHAELEAQRQDTNTAFGSTRHNVVGIVHNVRSAYNVGSIFRTADAMRMQRLVLSGYTPCPPRPDVCKTALGATDTVPWHYEADACAAIAHLRASGTMVVALELTTNAIPLSELVITGPVAIVVGNEVAGIDAAVLSACDAAIQIPMYGIKHSLNVAVAAGIAFYHIVQRLRCVDSQL